MNIKGIGTDIIEISRLKKAYARQKKPFLDKLFTKKEQEYCNKFKSPFLHFAARFAAKEALVKALGTGFGKDVSFLDIEITNNSNGKPEIRLSENLNKQFNTSKIHLSMSHSNDNAIAFVIIN